MHGGDEAKDFFMNDFEFVVDLLSKTGAVGNCLIDLEITKRNFNALKSKDDLCVQKQLNISLQRYHNEIDELHRIVGINPPPSNEPIPHNPRNELQYITDRIPAYVTLRELKGDLRAYAIEHLLSNGTGAV